MSYTEVGQENVDHTFKMISVVLMALCVIVLTLAEVQLNKQKKEIVQLQLDRAEMTQHLNQAYRALKDVDYQINVLTAEVMK